jgi:hypothetical protein
MNPKQVIFTRFANAGAPRDVANLMAEYIDGLQNRIAALESLAASNRALNDLSGRVAQLEAGNGPAHMRKTEKRG